MELGVINTTLTGVAKLVNEIKNNVTNLYTTKSLPEITKLTRVEPLCIVSRDLLTYADMPDISQSMLSIFAGHYLQAVSILTQINDVEVVRILDRLNPDRDETGFLMEVEKSGKTSWASESHSLESYQYSLPTRMVPALENEVKDSKDGGSGKTISEISNLSVGKLLNVRICYNKDADPEKSQSVTIPVNIRLLASVVPDPTIINLLTYKSEDNSITERWHAWRAGRIGFIRDLIFCQDLLDEYKRATIGDESGTLNEIMRRVNNSKKYGLLTKNPSLVAASNLFILSQEVAMEVEAKLGGKLSNLKIRNKAFENTYAMIIAVVDRTYERVTFYTRGIHASTDVSIKEIKASNKNGKGPDIMDLVKSMSMGSALSL